MKLSKKQLRSLIREELHRRRTVVLETFVRRLDELHPGSNLGSLLQQGVEKMWEADNLFQKAMAAAEDNNTWKLVNSLHSAMERITFEFDAKMQKIMQAASAPARSKAPPGVHTR